MFETKKIDYWIFANITLETDVNLTILDFPAKWCCSHRSHYVKGKILRTPKNICTHNTNMPVGCYIQHVKMLYWLFVQYTVKYRKMISKQNHENILKSE